MAVTARLLALFLLLPPAAFAAEDPGVLDGIMERLRRLRAAPIDGPVVTVVSWNVQVFGGGVKKPRREAAAEVLATIFKDPEAKILAAQEIANAKGAQTIGAMLNKLRGGEWTRSFEDTPDSQDNGFYVAGDVHIGCQGFLFPDHQRSAADRERSRHPARVAHLRVGELDFTAITLHLSFEGGRAEAAADELRHALDWVREYLSRPGADPDVMIVGDFNLPTRKGKELSSRGRELSWTPIEDVLSEYPEFETLFHALVDEPTSRPRGTPENNYDHFILSADLHDQEYVEGSAGRMPVDLLDEAEARRGTRVSDHYPIRARFRTGGTGADGRPVRPDGRPICSLAG